MPMPPQFQKAAKRKLAKKKPVEGSKAEEAGESKKEAAAEGDSPLMALFGKK
jgi:hypothetical protein